MFLETNEVSPYLQADGRTSEYLPHALLTDLTVNQLRLASVFLATAATAARHADELLKSEAIKKAFSLYCQVNIQLSELPTEEQNYLAREIEELRAELARAYAED